MVTIQKELENIAKGKNTKLASGDDLRVFCAVGDDASIVKAFVSGSAFID